MAGQEAELHQTQSDVIREVKALELRLVAKLQLVKSCGRGRAPDGSLLATKLHYYQ